MTLEELSTALFKIALAINEIVTEGEVVSADGVTLEADTESGKNVKINIKVSYKGGSEE